MPRARIAALNALSCLALATSIAVAMQAEPSSSVTPAAAVSWPVSTLVVSEVQTGGASASDEFVEIANGGASSVDLIGLEVVYVTSSGGTITRKATWPASTLLEPGRHLLIANTSGTFAGIADATYSGGFAATGGALVLRVVGGAPVDGLGWGDAANAFVEGTAAPAPPASSSIERRPGGIDGNGIDTNDNLTDWFVQAAPSPQNLAAPPAPAPGASPTPTLLPTPTTSPAPTPPATPVPTPTPTASPTVTPMPSPSSTPPPTATPDPTPSPTPEPTPSPTAVPTPTPTPTVEPTPTPDPSVSPPPSPGPAILSIAEARALPIDSTTTIEGVLTSELGALEDDRVGFVQDATAGIAVYLDAAPTTPWPTGSVVRLTGRIDERYAARTIRVAIGDVVVLGVAPVPAPLEVATGLVNEALEGRRVQISGVTVGSPTAFADGTGLYVDDGSGQVRAIVAPEALNGLSVPSGSHVRIFGPVGQRDSSGTGSAGYRIHATEPGSFAIVPDPSPTPTPEPTPSPLPSQSPDPTPDPSPTSTPTPTPSPSPMPPPDAQLDIASARSMPVGSHLRVTGVVIAEAGRLGLPPVFAIADETGGLPLRLASRMTAPVRGAFVTVDGVLAAPYGQLELRLVDGGLVLGGFGTLPAPQPIAAQDLGEASEGWLVTIDGILTVKATRSTSGDVSVEATDLAGQAFRILADASSGLTSSDFVKGAAYEIVGVVGQHASRKGTLDGYRIWLRDRADLRTLAGGAETSPGFVPAPVALSIRQALVHEGEDVVVEGAVIAGPQLLDTSGRRIVVADSSAAIEVVLPAGESARVGDWLRVSGDVGRAWGAPRIRAESVERIGAGSPILPETLRGGPGPAHEWRLVRVSGTVRDVTRLGATWRAELGVGGDRVVIAGLAGSGIPSTALVEGHPATIIGIVRRPYPTASDHRYQVVPRGAADVALGPTATGSGGASGAGRPTRSSGGLSVGEAVANPPLDIDLATLAEHVGELVRVGGLVVAPTPDGFSLDDATAVATIVLRSEAADFLGLFEPGDAVNAIGKVTRVGNVVVVVVEAGGGLVRVGDLGQQLPLEPVTTMAPEPAAPTRSLAGFGDPPALPAIGLFGLLAVSALSAALTLFRRRRRALRVADVARVRLAALSGDQRSA